MQLFDSRDTRYRAPFGAVAEGTEVFFRICLPRWLGCRGAFLCRRADGGMEQRDGMFWAGMAGEDHEWWDCRYAPKTADLYWYWFRLETDNGIRFLSCLPNGTAVLREDAADPWQLTCYEAEFRTPDWLAGGVMYQIFPDRFAGTGTFKKNVPADRMLRDDWGGQPHWRPDQNGEVRNNDFFGGDLEGIRQKLPFLKSLGVTCVYLNPIFESHSNHRYDTADYSRIDPLLGDEFDLKRLAKEAKALGIRLMLDGVFSHTGADSIYFNKYKRYPVEGACQSPTSPYAAWYTFTRWPEEYEGWWGFKTLPEVNELNDEFLSYITGENGIVERWLKAGISGWRLDVADELPDGFLDALRRRAKTVNPETLVLGEVWEDASNKQSYGHRRRYLLGRQLDSVMNYPFRTAILEFLRGGSGEVFFNAIYAVTENYPPQVTRLLMNSLGTHDTERALTMLAGEPTNGRGRRWQSETVMTAPQRARGKRLLKLASALQYTLPGVPCIYYGDEAGMEGYRDPFNRGCYPWGEEDEELIAWHRALGEMRSSSPVLREGRFSKVAEQSGAIAYQRRDESGALLAAVNPTEQEIVLPLPEEWHHAKTSLGEGKITNGLLYLPPLSCQILKA